MAEGGVAPYTCAASGAALPTDPTNGESCRYYWLREPFPVLGAYSNTVGWCFKHAAFQYDSDGDQMPDAPWPRCVSVTTGDVVPPIGDGNDALNFGCVAAPASLPAPLRRARSWIASGGVERPDKFGESATRGVQICCRGYRALGPSLRHHGDRTGRRFWHRTC